MTTDTNFVSVIIPCLNDYYRLKKCLGMLEKQTYPADAYEVIVVDNGASFKPYPGLSEFPHTKVIHEPHGGSYAARNRGIKRAKGEVFAFTDADCIPSSNWLENGVGKLLEKDNCGLVGGSIQVFFENDSHPTLAERFDKLTAFQQKQNIEKSHFSVTANLFTTKRVIEQVGMFNPNLKSGGDVEWGNRVHHNGLKLIHAENAVIYHPARKTFSLIFRKNRRVSQGFDPLNALGKSSPSGPVREWLGRISPPLSGSLKILRANDMGGIANRIAMIMILFAAKYFRLIVRLKKVITG
jgi:glycosyltransferase involved in cell wall biosynthesis